MYVHARRLVIGLAGLAIFVGVSFAVTYVLSNINMSYVLMFIKYGILTIIVAAYAYMLGYCLDIETQ